MAINEDILRKHFGFNNPDVIRNILNDPGQVARYESEYQRSINPQPAQPAPVDTTAFQKAQEAKIGEFTGRLQKVPEQLEAVRQEMGIPQAFETFGTLGETARGAAQRVEDLPEAIQQAVLGKDVSAGQLGRITAAKQQEALPGLRDVGRALESTGAGLESLLNEFTSRTQSAFAPFEMEAGLLGENIKNQYDLFKTQIQGELDKELQRITNQGAKDLKDIEKAMKLAELEQTANSVDFVDLGDKIGIFDSSGNLLRTEKKGKLGTLADGW